MKASVTSMSDAEEITLLTPLTDLEEYKGTKRMARIDYTFDKEHIPVWCRHVGGRLEMSSRQKCDLVLLGVERPERAGVLPVGLHAPGVRWPGVSRALGFVTTDKYHVTYAFAHQDMFTFGVAAKLAMSAAFSKVEGRVYNSNNVDGYLVKHWGVSSQMMADVFRASYTPTEGRWERSKVSGEHHTHIRPEEISKIANSLGGLRRSLVSRAAQLCTEVTGMNESAAGTFMLYALTAHPAAVMHLLASEKVWARSGLSINTLHNRLKELSVPMKSMHRADGQPLTQLFELNVLVNRGIGEVDWASEQQNRTRPNVINVDQIDVYKSAMRVFADGVVKGFRYPRMSRDHYLDNRWEWAPSGSVHSQYEEDREMVAKDRAVKTKFVTLSRMSKKMINSMFNGAPELCAWKSTKYEWGKQRAIYGTDLRSTVITNLPMYRCEEALRHRFPIGPDAEAKRVHKRLKGMLSTADAFCYDFSDFNSQHSLASMGAVLQAYYDTHVNSMHPDQQAAMRWVIKSVFNMKVMNNDEEDYKVVGTLLSGWRLTTFMNTVLNYIYVELAGAMSVPGFVDSVHNGDDVLMTVDSVASAAEIVARMNRINARAQSAKCNLFSLGEFLRVEHRDAGGSSDGAQYLSRACATAVHSRTESQVPTHAIAATGSVYKRVEELVERGTTTDVAEAIRDVMLDNISRVFKLPANLLKHAARTHVLAGGVSTHRWASVSHKFTETCSYIEHEEISLEMLEPGIRDFSKALLRMLGDYVTADHILPAIRRATRTALSLTRDVILDVTKITNQRSMRFARSLYGRDRGVLRTTAMSRARMLGLPPAMLCDGAAAEKLKKIIGSERDPLWALKVLI